MMYRMAVVQCRRDGIQWRGGGAEEANYTRRTCASSF